MRSRASSRSRGLLVGSSSSDRHVMSRSVRSLRGANVGEAVPRVSSCCCTPAGRPRSSAAPSRAAPTPRETAPSVPQGSARTGRHTRRPAAAPCRRRSRQCPHTRALARLSCFPSLGHGELGRNCAAISRTVLPHGFRRPGVDVVQPPLPLEPPARIDRQVGGARIGRQRGEDRGLECPIGLELQPFRQRVGFPVTPTVARRIDRPKARLERGGELGSRARWTFCAPPDPLKTLKKKSPCHCPCLCLCLVDPGRTQGPTRGPTFRASSERRSVF